MLCLGLKKDNMYNKIKLMNNYTEKAKDIVKL